MLYAPVCRFNLDCAWALLGPEQQAVFVAPAAAKGKAQLGPVVAESCYDNTSTGVPTEGWCLMRLALAL